MVAIESGPDPLPLRSWGRSCCARLAFARRVMSRQTANEMEWGALNLESSGLDISQQAFSCCAQLQNSSSGEMI